MQQRKYYRINEVAEMLDVPATTLRWWEQAIDAFVPNRTKGGQRHYTAADVEVVRKIKSMSDEGLSLEAISTRLQKSAPLKYPHYCGNVKEALNLLTRLSKLVEENPRALSMIGAVKRYLKRPRKTTDN